MQHTVVHCNTAILQHTVYILQHSSEDLRNYIYNTLQNTAIVQHCTTATHCNTAILQHTATLHYCNTLQHCATASHCNTALLQHTATCYNTTAKYPTLEVGTLVATHCNTLQCCNTPHRTAPFPSMLPYDTTRFRSDKENSTVDRGGSVSQYKGISSNQSGSVRHITSHAITSHGITSHGITSHGITSHQIVQSMSWHLYSRSCLPTEWQRPHRMPYLCWFFPQKNPVLHGSFVENVQTDTPF